MRRQAIPTALLIALCALGALAAPAAQANRNLLSEEVLHPALGPPAAPPPDGQVEGACGLALSGATLYVSDYYHRRIDAFATATGAYDPTRSLALPGSNPVFGTNTLDGVCGLALDSSANLYANEFHEGVVRLEPSEATIDSGESTGLAVDAAGDLFVDDRTRVVEYEAPVAPGDPPAAVIGLGSLQDAYGLAVSASGTRLYVPDAGTETVKVFEPATSLSVPVATISHGFTSLADAAVALDPGNGHLLVLDDAQPGYEHPKAAIYEFDAAGTFLGKLPGAPVFGEPSGILAAPDGTLYVTDGNSEESNVFSYSPYSASIPAPPSSSLSAPASAAASTAALAPKRAGASSSAATSDRRRRANASEVTQHGRLRVSFAARVAPKRLPRQGVAPVSASLGGQISTTDGSDPPQLRKVTIAINAHAQIDPGALPPCHLSEIDPSTSAGALQACRRSLLGEGSFSADVKLPSQSPFPSAGKILAFNGRLHGKPVILAHVYGTRPVPTSIILPFAIEGAKGGTFGTTLEASLPRVTGDWGYVTGLTLNFSRASNHGRSYISAGCPAPPGFPGATFALARTSFAFAGGPTLRATLVRSCRVR